MIFDFKAGPKLDYCPGTDGPVGQIGKRPEPTSDEPLPPNAQVHRNDREAGVSGGTPS